MRETAIFPLPILGRFQSIFSSEKQKVRHISTSGLFGLPTSKACHVLSHPRSLIISTKFEVDTTIHR